MDYQTTEREYVNSGNLFRGAYGLVAFLYLFPQIALYSTLYVHCFRDLVLKSSYGVLLCWNMFKVAVLGLIIFCAVQRRLSLGFGLLFGAVVVLVAVGSLALLLHMIIDSASVANRPGTQFDHPSHDPLYCCVFFNVTPGCEGKGPCANVNVTNTSLPLGEPGEIFPLVERKHLRLNQNFKLGIGLVATCLLLETVIVGFFFIILRALNSGSGLFVPPTPKNAPNERKTKAPPHQGHPSAFAMRYSEGGSYERIGGKSYADRTPNPFDRDDSEPHFAKEEFDNDDDEKKSNDRHDDKEFAGNSATSKAWTEVRLAMERLSEGCPKMMVGIFLWLGLALLGLYKATMKCVVYAWKSVGAVFNSVLAEPARSERQGRRQPRFPRGGTRDREQYLAGQDDTVPQRFGGRQSLF